MMKMMKRFSVFFFVLMLLSAAGMFGAERVEAASTADKLTQTKQVTQAKQPKQNQASWGQDEPLVYVEQGLNLISAEKQAELTRKLEALNAKYGVHVGIHIVKNLPAGAANLEQEAKRFVESGVYNEGTNGSMVLYITMSNRKYYIATGNYMNRRITSATGIPYIKDEIVPALKDNEFDRAAELFVDAAEKELAYYAEEGEPYDPANEFSICALLIGLIGAACVGFCVCAYLVSCMSNVSFAGQADEYLDRDSFELTFSEDTYLYTTTTVTPKSKGKDDDDSSSSSSDRGSTGGGGGSF